MKYFIVIEGEQQGPYQLEELIERGVRPGTYVWCKGMSDWQRADEVPEICRLFRNHLSGLIHPTSEESQENRTPDSEASPYDSIPPLFRHAVEKSGIPPGPPLDLSENKEEPPRVSLTIAILTALLCFPPTGFIAIYYTFRAQQTWRRHIKEEQARDPMQNKDRQTDLRDMAHDYARLSKMWTGLTISLGLIFFTVIFSKTM